MRVYFVLVLCAIAYTEVVVADENKEKVTIIVDKPAKVSVLERESRDIKSEILLEHNDQYADTTIKQKRQARGLSMRHERAENLESTKREYQQIRASSELRNRRSFGNKRETDLSGIDASEHFKVRGDSDSNRDKRQTGQMDQGTLAGQGQSTDLGQIQSGGAEKISKRETGKEEAAIKQQPKRTVPIEKELSAEEPKQKGLPEVSKRHAPNRQRYRRDQSEQDELLTKHDNRDSYLSPQYKEAHKFDKRNVEHQEQQASGLVQQEQRRENRDINDQKGSDQNQSQVAVRQQQKREESPEPDQGESRSIKGLEGQQENVRNERNEGQKANQGEARLEEGLEGQKESVRNERHNQYHVIQGKSRAERSYSSVYDSKLGDNQEEASQQNQ